MPKKSFVISIVTLAIVAYTGWLGYVELRGEEPRRAIVALEMLITGDYLVPHINGLPYYNKPPVYNWLMLGAFKIFSNTDEWVVRLPGLLSLFGMVLLLWWYAKKHLNSITTLLASLFLLTAGDLLFYGGVYTGEIDTFYSLLVIAQALAIFHFKSKGNYLLLYSLSYALAAVGFLTKGIPSIAFQGLTFVAMAFVSREWKWWFHWTHLLGVAVFVGLCSAYLVPYSTEADITGLLVRQFDEATMKTGLETPFIDTVFQFFTFPLQLIKLILPWGVIALLFFRRSWIRSMRSEPFLLFSVLFILFNIPIYWFSGNFSARYLYMFLPFIALLLAHAFQIDTESRLKRIIEYILAGLGILTAFAFLAPPFIEQTKDFDGVWIKSILGFGVAGIIAWMMLRAQQKIWYVVLLLLVVRIGYNTFYLPAFQNDPNAAPYRQNVSDMLEITNGESFEFLTPRYVMRTDAAIGPIQFKELGLETTFPIVYQIPYYHTRATGKVMTNIYESKPGQFHLTPIKYLKDMERYEILYRCMDRARKVELALVRLKD